MIKNKDCNVSIASFGFEGRIESINKNRFTFFSFYDHSTIRSMGKVIDYLFDGVSNRDT